MAGGAFFCFTGAGWSDEKCQAYMAARPELVPGFIDLAEMAKDRKLVADLLPCLCEAAPSTQTF